MIARTKEIVDPNAIRLTDAEIAEFVKAAEQEMFAMFGGDTNQKYKTKYRSLIYNIRDRKNLTLFEKISKKLIDPKQLVRMSTEELASQELAEWRNNENKHQLEMITKSELDLLASGNTYVLKTHKGEEVIQDAERISLDRSLPVEDLVSALNSSAVSSSDGTVTKDNRFGKYLSPDGKSSLHSSSSKRDGSRSHEKEKKSDRHSSSKHKRKRSRERHSSHGHSSSSHGHKDKDRDKDRKEHKSKDKPKEHKSSSSSSSRSKHHDKPSDKDRSYKREASHNSNSSNSNSSSNNKSNPPAPRAPKAEDISIIDKILKAESTINSILHPEECRKVSVSNADDTPSAGPMAVSSGSLNESAAALTRQPSATANESDDQEPTSTVTSPPELTPEIQSTPPPIEKQVSFNSVVWSGAISMIDVATFKVSLSVLSGSTEAIEFPKEFDVVGRIGPDTVWDYLEKIRVSKDIVLLRFSPLTLSDDETAYSTFIQYLDSRQRLGVIKIPSKMVKDFYILPLTSHKSLPTILKTTTGFDLGANRPDLLLGIIVRNVQPYSQHNVRNRSMTPSAPVHLPPSKYRQPVASVLPPFANKAVVSAFLFMNMALAQ